MGILGHLYSDGSFAQDLIRADREGNWPLHLHSVQALLPLFAVFDRINYLRWCSLYLEDMRKLVDTAPDIFESFMAGKFQVPYSNNVSVSR